MGLFLASVIIVALAFVALGIRIFLHPSAKFAETEIARNPNMRKLGITCVQCDERQYWKSVGKKKKIKINPTKLKLDLPL